MDCSPWPARLLCLWNSPGENTWVCSHSLPKSPTTVHQSFRLHLLWLPLNVCILLASFYGAGRHCMACGILAPQPGIEPTPPTLEGEVLTTGPAGRSLCSVCVSVFCCFPVFFGETWGFVVVSQSLLVKPEGFYNLLNIVTNQTYFLHSRHLPPATVFCIWFFWKSPLQYHMGIPSAICPKWLSYPFATNFLKLPTFTMKVVINITVHYSCDKCDEGNVHWCQETMC